MESQANLKVKPSFRMRFSKKIIITAISIVVIAAIIVTYIITAKPFAAKSQVQQRVAQATKGNISVKISGSGPVSSANRVEVPSTVAGKISKVYFKEGDKVKAGDLILELDSTDVQQNISDLETKIAEQNAQQEAASLVDIQTQSGGKVTSILVSNGKTVSKGDKLMVITDMSKAVLNVTVSKDAISNIRQGQNVTVYVKDLNKSVSGAVTNVDNSTSSLQVNVENSGDLNSGMKASVEITGNNGSKVTSSTGSLQFTSTQTIRSTTDGTVNSLKVSKNSIVESGDVVAIIKSSSQQNSNSQGGSQDLDTQLADAQKQLESYKIYAPISGEIVSQTVRVGDSVKAADVVTTISDPNSMQMTVDIDELDIAKIKTGQQASITVDALPDTDTKPLTGEVVKKAIEGTSSNGVTTYPVTIKINETANLLAGMNANADITISEKQDVLMVPVEAVQKRGNTSFVWVKSNGSSSNSQGNSGGNGQGNYSNNSQNGQQSSGNNSQNGYSRGSGYGNSSGNRQIRSAISSALDYYKNATMKQVEIGINNDSFVEIVSGLNEGDQVILPPLTTNSTSTQTNTQIGGFGMGGFGGAFGGGGNYRVRSSNGSNSSSSSDKNTGSSSSGSSSGNAGQGNQSQAK